MSLKLFKSWNGQAGGQDHVLSQADALTKKIKIKSSQITLFLIGILTFATAPAWLGVDRLIISVIVNHPPTTTQPTTIVVLRSNRAIANLSKYEKLKIRNNLDFRQFAFG